MFNIAERRTIYTLHIKKRKSIFISWHQMMRGIFYETCQYWNEANAVSAENFDIINDTCHGTVEIYIGKL